jgi:hypothetical protein
VFVGRTISTFRLALEGEIEGWKHFRESLKSAESRELLDRMFAQARSNCMGVGNAVRPVVFQGLFMAIAFSHEKRIAQVRGEMEKIRLELRKE